MTDKTLQDRLREGQQYDYESGDACSADYIMGEAADALDAQAERIKALEGALRSLVDLADAPATSVSVVSAAHDRIVNRARELLGEK